MQIVTQKIKFLASVLVVLIFFSCEKDIVNQPVITNTSGVVVVNQGNFLSNNGTISFINLLNDSVQNNLFNNSNGRSIDGIIQDYEEINNIGIVLVDNSAAGKDVIEIITPSTFKSIATLPAGEIENPRKVIKAGEMKAYITCYGETGVYPDYFANNGYIAVLDLKTNKITKKIILGKGVEQLFKVGNEVFVGNASDDNQNVAIVNSQTDEFLKNVKIGKSASVIGADINNKLWLYTEGKFLKTSTDFSKIESYTITYPEGKKATSSNFAFSKDKKSIIFVDSYYDAADSYKQKGNTKQIDVNTTNNPFSEFSPRIFSSLGVNPTNGDVYAGITPSYVTNGYVARYKSNNTLIDSLKVGIGPVKFFFR